MANQFQFLHAEWPDVHEAASKAAAAVHPDPRTACFYARRAKPDAALAFDAGALPRSAPVPKRAVDYLLKLKTGLRERDEKLSEVLADKSALDEELKRLRAEAAEAKKASAAQPDTHDYSETETRDYFIDLLLKEAGWPLDQPRDREFEVSGMPNAQGRGFVDYVLWADDGRPLAVVEAKRTRKSAAIGQQQAKLYADCLESRFGQRPVIFYSNGYDHWLWDDVNYPPRAVQGFFKKAELELMIQRRTSRKSLADAPVNTKIVERFYQARTIRRIGEAFEKDRDRKALVIMATGAGKTRTVIALCDLLMQCNWAKRVLFLADRVALVKPAVNAFKAHLPDASPVNLVTEKDGERMLATSGIGDAGNLRKAREESHGLGLFVRSLVGLDREAAKQAFAGFVAGTTLDANQIEFVNLIVDHLTEHGVMGAALLYESPFTDVTPRGPDGLFTSPQLDALLAVLDQVRAAALAA